MNFEFDNIKTASAIPGAAAMIETFRAIGYSLETAVADILWTTRYRHRPKTYGSTGSGKEEIPL